MRQHIRAARAVLGGVLAGPLAVTAACLAGCAAAGSSAGPPSVVAVSLTGSPPQRARADATSMLSAFVPPPGAHRLAAAPRVSGGWLQQPSTSLVSSALVDQARWYQAPGSAAALISWESARLPSVFRPGDSDYGPPSWDREWDLGPAPGGILVRSLVEEAVTLDGGHVAIRVDAQVSWQPPRPAASQVPASATVVTVAEAPSPDPRATRPPAPVTITDPAVVQRLARLVNGFSAATNIGAPCPAFLGYEVRLTFRARPGGSPVATVTGPDPDFCGDIVVTDATGKQQPPLTQPDAFLAKIFTAAGLRWPSG